jgi:hydrogenase maturation factor
MIFDSQGLIACGRYSFAPNSLHYCGPEKQRDMLEYVTEGQVDRGLFEIQSKFETLYPYLVLIASENNIKDPFDRRVVEAYWLGNSLLQRIKIRAFAKHLDTLNLQQSIDSIVESGVPQHNFHVMNIFIRTGHHMVKHTLSTMDQCRISWGRVVEVEKQYVVEIQPLQYIQDRLTLGVKEKKVVTSIAVKPEVGDWVSIHWGYVCDILTSRQRLNLMHFTQKALITANENIYHR